MVSRAKQCNVPVRLRYRYETDARVNCVVFVSANKMFDALAILAIIRKQ